MSTPLRSSSGPDVHAIARHTGYVLGLTIVAVGLVLFLVHHGTLNETGQLVGMGTMGVGAVFVFGTFMAQFF